MQALARRTRSSVPRRAVLLSVGTDRWGEEILIAPADLVRARGAEVVNLTDRERPVVPT